MKYVDTGSGKLPLISLIAILSVSLTINMPGLAVSPMLGKLHDVFHSSVVESQLITSLPNLFMIPVVIIAGKLATPRRQTAIMSAGLLLFLLSGIGCFFANSMAVLIVLGCLVGIGCGMVVPLAAGYISEWFFGRDRQQDLGFKSTTSNAMVVVANIYVGIVAAVSWRAAFIVYLIPVIPLALLPFMTQKYIKAHRIVSGNPTEKNSQSEASAGSNGAYHFQGRQSTVLLVMVCVLYCVLTYATTSISYYAPFTMKAYGMSTSEVGIVTAAYYLTCAFAGAVVATVKRWVGPNVVLISLAVCATGLAVMGLTHNFWIYAIMALCIGFAYGVIQPIIYNKTTYIAPNHKEGTQYFGYVLSMNYIGIMMVPFIDVFFRNLFGTHDPGFEFLFSGCVVGLLLLWGFIERKNYVFHSNPASASPTGAEIADS